MKKTSMAILLLLAAMNICAQSVTYMYDNAGNRTDRVISMNSTRSQTTEDTEETTPTLSDLIAEKAITIYPNPTKGMLSVEIKEYSDELQAEFRLMDMSGRMIFDRKANTNYQTFDLSGQPAGIYLLQIRINDESVVWKIVKQ